MFFKKPKFWDEKKVNLISFFLLPFTIVIYFSNIVKNFYKERKFNIKTICVGNIYLGGTGKTPTTIKLYQLLSQLGYEVITAKKKYKDHLDEKFILEKKTETIFLKNRKEIINKAISMKKKILIFDDGLQDKKISYDIEFVCFDQKNWLGNGLLLPSGPLREKIKSLKKYSCVFLKKNGEDISNKIQLIKNINPNLEKLIYNLDRQFLHAKVIGFIHPKFEKKLRFTSILPDDLSNIVKTLRNIDK